ncbi:hypothetical protein GTP44_24205 [Duganella sp. FT50W]|uniref:Uncharacterized protein n=1 Tax=Duganella lactea TaxID=2692173 RepID=A0A6L8MSL5_9BURK|nr:hypothetical protein [Duganella lactea]
MPLLAQFLWTVFGGAVQWLAKFLTQKVAIAVVLIGIATALFIALYLALRTLISGALVSVSGTRPLNVAVSRIFAGMTCVILGLVGMFRVEHRCMSYSRIWCTG